jgi:hypothetical protein
MEENEDKNENKEKTIVENNDNKKKYIIPVLIIVIVILIVGTCYLYMNSINKQKSIADKEKTIKKQQEELLNISKDKDKENEKKKEKEKQTTKPNEQKQETKYLSKEEYLRIFKELVGTDFPGEHNTRANDKKIEIIENPKEGMYPNSKYTIRKSGMLKQPSSGIAEGEYNILTKEEVKKLLYDFTKKMGYSNVTEYKDNYERSENNIKQLSKPSDLSVELEAKNSKNGILRLAILFLRDKDNKVTNKVYSAYVGIY